MTDSAPENLPLSQGTYDALLNVLGSSANGIIPYTSALDWENIQLPSTSQVEYIGEIPCQPSTSAPQPVINPDALIPVSNWPGKYSFKVFIESREPLSKKVSYVFSNKFKKLYVNKDAVCPISFSTGSPVGRNSFVRAMAVFSEPKHVKEIVHRCLNHSMAEINNGVFEAEHLVRCESVMSFYQTDMGTKRQSVYVPLENPPVGQSFSTYLYKFGCFNSCSGGPNRRPITLVFTLQEGADVVGRQSFELKVCACPFRDKMNDEKLTESNSCENLGMKKKIQTMPQLVSPKRSKTSNNSNQVAFPQKTMDIQAFKLPAEPELKNYVVMANNQGMYKFLLEMKKLYELQTVCAKLAINTSDMRHFLCLVRSSSDEEDEKS